MQSSDGEHPAQVLRTQPLWSVTSAKNLHTASRCVQFRSSAPGVQQAIRRVTRRAQLTGDAAWGLSFDVAVSTRSWARSCQVVRLLTHAHSSVCDFVVVVAKECAYLSFCSYLKGRCPFTIHNMMVGTFPCSISLGWQLAIKCFSLKVIFCLWRTEALDLTALEGRVWFGIAQRWHWLHFSALFDYQSPIFDSDPSQSMRLDAGSWLGWNRCAASMDVVRRKGREGRREGDKAKLRSSIQPEADSVTSASLWKGKLSLHHRQISAQTCKVACI